MSPIIPPRDDSQELVATSVRMPKWLLRKIDEVVRAEKANRYSRNDVIVYLLTDGERRYWAEKEQEKGAKK